MSDDQTALVAVDWGTSSLRAARLDLQGKVLEERFLPRGILTLLVNDFAPFFKANFADWTRASGTLSLISGMAGSKQGWKEAPYCPCPAGFDEVAAALTWIEPQRIAIVPGLSCEHAHAPDVMRGEEVQIFGAMQLTGLRDGLFVLPGTHSKWAQVQNGRVITFRTYMTGEFYALLIPSSFLIETNYGKIDASIFLRKCVYGTATSSRSGIGMSSPSNREGGAQGGRPSGVLSRVGGVVAAAAGCVAGADGVGVCPCSLAGAIDVFRPVAVADALGIGHGIK